MTEKYVDATASGANDGSSQANAWESAQEAIDDVSGGAIVAGDNVLCRHTASPDEQPTVVVDVDGSIGTSSNFIRFTGVNSSWVEDGSRYELDFQNASSTNGLAFAGTTDYHIWKHFEVYNADLSGVNFVATTPLYPRLVNIVSRNNGQKGFALNNAIYGRYLGLLAYGNGHEGFNSTRGTFIFCCGRDNTEEGFNGINGTGHIIYNCEFFDNTKWGLLVDLRATIINTVVDGNVLDNVYLNDISNLILGSRITNAPASKYGIDVNSNDFVSGFNYFQDNAGGNKLDATNEVLDLFNFTGDSDTSQYDQGDTDAGYKSLTEGAEDYELETDATLFEAEIQIPTGQ